MIPDRLAIDPAVRAAVLATVTADELRRLAAARPEAHAVMADIVLSPMLQQNPETLRDFRTAQGLDPYAPVFGHDQPGARPCPTCGIYVQSLAATRDCDDSWHTERPAPAGAR